MAKSNNEVTWKSYNVFVPKYVPKNLKGFERDKLEIQYRYSFYKKKNC